MPFQRSISWLKAARKEFEGFPLEVRIDIEAALIIAARGGKADTAKGIPLDRMIFIGDSDGDYRAAVQLGLPL